MTLACFMFPAIWKEVSKDQGSETQISKVKSHKRHVVDQDLSGWTDSSPQNPLNPDLGYHAEAIQSPALCQEPEARSRDLARYRKQRLFMGQASLLPQQVHSGQFNSIPPSLPR